MCPGVVKNYLLSSRSISQLPMGILRATSFNFCNTHWACIYTCKKLLLRTWSRLQIKFSYPSNTGGSQLKAAEKYQDQYGTQGPYLHRILFFFFPPHKIVLSQRRLELSSTNRKQTGVLAPLAQWCQNNHWLQQEHDFNLHFQVDKTLHWQMQWAAS